MPRWRLLETIAPLFSFKGRVGRATWWLVCLLVPLALIVVHLVALFTLAYILEMITGSLARTGSMTGKEWLWPPLVLLAIPFLWIYVATWIKRLHDRNMSGAWALLLLVPIAGLWPIFVCAFLPGANGRNQYGDNPIEWRRDASVR